MSRKYQNSKNDKPQVFAPKEGALPFDGDAVGRVERFVRLWRIQGFAKIRDSVANDGNIPEALDVVASLSHKDLLRNGSEPEVFELTLADLDALISLAQPTRVEMGMTISNIVDRYQATSRRQILVLNTIIERYKSDGQTIQQIKDLLATAERDGWEEAETLNNLRGLLAEPVEAEIVTEKG